MQETKKSVIGGKSYEIYHMTPSVALKNYLKLQKYLLGPIGEALNSAGNVSDLKTALDSNIDLGSALGKLGEAINPDEMTNLFKELIQYGARDEKGAELPFEIHFMGDIPQIFAVVKEVINHNYPNFFGILFGLVDLGPKAASTQAK